LTIVLTEGILVNLDSHEPIIQVLQATANPIRKAVIEALEKGEMRFSQLLSTCGLDYDHDAGHFYYHLSELMSKQIVQKKGDIYYLTEFGSKIAEMLNSLQQECSFLLSKNQSYDVVNMKIDDTRVVRMRWNDFSSLLGRNIDNEVLSLPQSEKEELEKFENWAFPSEDKKYYHPIILAVKKGNEVLGFMEAIGATVVSTREPVAASNRVLITKFVVTSIDYLHERGRIGELMLSELSRQAEEYGATSIEAVNISAEDEELLAAFKNLGFERKSVGYNLMRNFNKEPTEFVPTVGPSPVSCTKCGGRRFKFVKKQETDKKTCAVYACHKCGQMKIVTNGK